MTLSGCARKKSVDQSCRQQITQTEELYQGKTGSLPKSQDTIITNLITAAKIHQQHGEEMLCIEKIQRANTLLEEQKPDKKTEQ
jgi:hypothetical protein